MKWAPGDCKTADIIRIKTGSVYHFGIFLSEDEVIQFGYPPLPEFAEKNSPPVVCSVDIDTFCCGRIAERAELDRFERRKRFPPEKTAELARSRLGEGGYNIIHNNCEHFVNECVFGVKRSEQEETVRKKWRDRATLDVYVAGLSECGADGVMAYALERTGGISGDGRGCTEDGGTFTAADGVYVSFEKTGGYTAVAVSDRPVGLGAAAYGEDPEKLKKQICGIFERVDGDAAVTRLYAQKKSVFRFERKADFEPKRIKTSKYPVKAFSVPEIPDIVISVCGQTENLRCFVYENGEAKFKSRKITAVL